MYLALPGAVAAQTGLNNQKLTALLMDPPISDLSILGHFK